MPKAEAPGHVGRAKEIDAAAARRWPPSPTPRASRPRPRRARARTDRPPPPLLRARGARSRTAARAPPRAPRRRVDGTPIAAERRLVVHGRCSARAAERPGELLEIERVAAALGVEDARVDAIDRVAQQLARLVGAERAELDAGQQVRRASARSSAVDRRSGHVARTHGQRQEHRRGRRPAEQRSEQLDRRRVGPVEVVEHEHERLRRPRAARAASARRGGCDSARAGARPGDRPRASSSDGKTCASSVRTSSSRHGEASRGSSPRTYSSSASTKTENGRSRSSSDAEPVSTRCPGSPRERRARPGGASFRCPARRRAGLRPSGLDRAPPETRSSELSSSARPTRWSVCRATRLLREHRSGSREPQRSGCEIRVAP